MNIDRIREKLINRRKSLGLSLEESCDGFSRFTLSRFEKGDDITLSNFLSLVEKLNCDFTLIERR